MTIYIHPITKTYEEYFKERRYQFEKSDFNVDPALFVAHEQNCVVGA